MGGKSIDTSKKNKKELIEEVQVLRSRLEELEHGKVEFKQLEESLKQYQLMVESAYDAIFFKDLNSRYIVANDKTLEAFVLSREQVIGKNDYEIMPNKEEARKNIEDDNLVFKTGKLTEVTKRMTGVNEKDRWFEAIKVPQFNDRGNVIGLVGIARDITDRKQVELRQDELIKKVENINNELKEFASIVSHDLKAPLRGIKTLANWILSDYADRLDGKANEQINLLLDRVERMYNLIEGTLQYSRAGRAKGKRVRVNLNNFVPEIINMVVPPENITVTIENELPVIECGETHIMQVFQNLLSNAIKYMDKPQGWIKIGCVEQDGFWKFSVADNGPGIEEKHFENIFKIFQALPTSPDFQGTGVGLTVAKKIVELYDGEIWVESKIGKGSSFFFTLPKQKIKAKNEKLEANITC